MTITFLWNLRAKGLFSASSRFRAGIPTLPLFRHSTALMAAGDGPTDATMEEQEFDSVLGETTMSMCRLVAGLLGLAFVTAAAMAITSIGETAALQDSDAPMSALGHVWTAPD